MKHTLFALLAATCLGQLKAQAPEKMSYQAVVRNSGGQLVINQTIGMRISLLKGSVTGTAVYTETHAPMSNANGLVTLEIGGGTVVAGSFSTIDWSKGPYFVRTETDPAGGSNYTIVGTSQLLSVPYALHAKTAETVTRGGGFTHYLGENFGGGIIFQLWKDAQGAEHGLIVDINNLSTTEIWSNEAWTLIGSGAQSLWDGKSNSAAIIAQPGHTKSLASLCKASTSGGQNDWYLPSIDELVLLWNNRYFVNKALSAISGATLLSNNALYWSSTEYNADFARTMKFDYGTPSENNKSTRNITSRAIRSF